MHIQQGLVSTIVPVYNRPSLLVEAVGSVLTQSYENIEVIIVDDGSSDETPKAAESLVRAGDGRVRLIRTENRGVGAARETGRMAARGEFIQYLDSDDLLLPGKFLCQVSGLRTCPDCDVAYGNTQYRGVDGTLMARGDKNFPGRVTHMFPSFLRARWWETATPLYRRTLTDRAGPWTSLSHEEDWEYDCRIAAIAGPLWYCDRFVAEHRDHASARLSRGDALEPRRMRSRAEAHARILDHARRAEVDPASPEMQHFGRELFLLARQCGAARLPFQSRQLLSLARETSARQLDINVYAFLAHVLGYTLLGMATCWSDRLRTTPSI